MFYLSSLEKIKSTDYNDRYITLINQVDGEKRSGRLLLNVRKDSLNHQLETGTSLHIKGTVYKNKPQLIQNQFDYSTYLENKQIYAQLYSDHESINIGSDYKKDVWYYSSKNKNCYNR
jgi:competence protein ComEC